MSRRLPFANVLVVALCALATMLTLVVRPAPRLSARGHETISALRARTGEISRSERATKSADRPRAHQAHGSAPALPVPFAIACALPSIAPLAITDALRPFTWIAWRAPTRARADLMVFLN